MADMTEWERRMAEQAAQNQQNQQNTNPAPTTSGGTGWNFNDPVPPTPTPTPSNPTPSNPTPSTPTPIAYTNPSGGVEYYTPTDNPNIGIDAGGNRVYIGGYVPGGYTTPNTRAIESNTPISSSNAEYTGQASALGGTWGKTPATLAQEAFVGGQIAYTVTNADGTSREATKAEAKQILQQAISGMNIQQQAQYKTALAILENAPGATPEEKLAYVQQQTSKEALALPISQRTIQDQSVIGRQEQSTIKTASEPGTATTISSESYKLLEPKYRDILDKQGYDAFEKEYAKDHVKLADGTYITNSTWAHLPKSDQQFIIDKGYDAYVDRENAKAIKLKDGSFIAQSQYDSLPPKMQEALKKDGFEAINLSKLSPEDQFKKMQEWDMIPKDAEFGGLDDQGNVTFKPSDSQVKEAMPWYQSVWESTTPWDESKGEKATAEGVATMAAETLVPFVYSIRNWDKMSDQEKALSLGMDLVSSALIVIPAVRGVSTAVRMGMNVPEAIARGTGRVAAEVTYRQVTDPVRMLMHPIETAKMPFRFFKEIAGGKTVPYEAHFRGTAGGEFGSDLKLKIGGGNEVAGATLEGVNELTKAGMAGTKAETLVGTQLIKYSNTGFEKIAGRPVQTHSSPGIEKFLNEIDETGVITVKGNDREAAMFSSVGGTEFWRQSATGGMGQIPGGMHIEGEVEMLSNKVAKLRDPAKTQEAMVQMAKDDKLANKATVGSKSYHNTIEFESMQWENSKLKPVMTDKPKTFKWKEPEAVLSARSAELMQMAAQAEKMAKQSKTVQEAAVHLKNSDNLAKQSVETYKEAIKKGISKQVTTNVDYLESIDPITGQNLIFLHLVQEGFENTAKPWTKAQIAGWKVKGFMNIPRDIFVPALQKPKMSPEKLITEVGKRLNQSERNRLADGLELMDILSKQKVSPRKFAAVSMADVEMIPKESAKEIDKWFATHDHRLYGSMIEWTQARTPFTAKPNDLDFALNNPEKGINEIADIIRRTSDIKITVEPARLGGAGAVIRNSKGEIIIEGHSMIEHLHDLPFGMPVSKPTVQAGIFKQEQLSEQLMRRGNALLMPGFGPQGRQAFGPEAAAMYKRMKDYGKFGDASVELIASMREEAAGLSGLAKKSKLAEADRAEVLLKNFIKKPSVADLKAAGLDPKATLEQYYDMMGKKFNAAAEKVEAALPKVNPDKYLPEYEKRAKIDNAVERYVGEYRKQKLAEKALSYTSRNIPTRLGTTIAKGRISADGHVSERPTAERITQSRKTPGRISAERVSAERITPDRVSPERVSPDRITPDRITPDRITPDRTSLRRTAPDRVAPDRITPDRVAPDRVTPDRITPERTTPDRVRPDRTTPERITPDRITPDRIRPERITPDRNIPRIPRRAIIFIQDHSEHKNLDPKRFEGAIAWRQGLFYQIRWQPFGKEDVFYSQEPIPGVKYHEGLGSAAKSAVALYGEVPRNVRLDMGIVDINITRGQDVRKPILGFKADSKQKTHYNGIEKDSGSIKKSK